MQTYLQIVQSFQMTLPYLRFSFSGIFVLHVTGVAKGVIEQVYFYLPFLKLTLCESPIRRFELILSSNGSLFQKDMKSSFSVLLVFTIHETRAIMPDSIPTVLLQSTTELKKPQDTCGEMTSSSLW